MESREDPRMNQSGMLDMLEYHGYVQGKILLEYGHDAATRSRTRCGTTSSTSSRSAATSSRCS